MRRSLLAAGLIGAPLLLSLALIGCGNPKDEDPSKSAVENGGGPKNNTTAGPSAALKPVEGKAGATLKGRVTLKGNAPDVAALTEQLQGAMKSSQSKEACFEMAPDAEKSEQIWKIGKDNGVGNVVVWIQPDAGDYFKSDPAKPTWPLKVELNQPHCEFIPHVTWVVPAVLTDNPKKAVPSGQKFFVTNTATISHNTKWSSESGPNEGDGGVLQPNTAPHEVDLTGNNQMVHFQCNIHPWMDAWVLVFNHPYAAVTDADGNFTIKNVPAGHKVRVTAWHEKGPYNNFLTPNKIKGDEMELTDGDNKRNFDFVIK